MKFLISILEIRNGLPGDMNSINCGIAFPNDTNCRDSQSILLDIEDFLEKIRKLISDQIYCLY